MFATSTSVGEQALHPHQQHRLHPAAGEGLPVLHPAGAQQHHAHWHSPLSHVINKTSTSMLQLVVSILMYQSAVALQRDMV